MVQDSEESDNGGDLDKQILQIFSYLLLEGPGSFLHHKTTHFEARKPLGMLPTKTKHLISIFQHSSCLTCKSNTRRLLRLYIDDEITGHLSKANKPIYRARH